MIETLPEAYKAAIQDINGEQQFEITRQLLYAGHALIEIDGKKVLTHLDLCEDCILFIANGDIPNSWEY